MSEIILHNQILILSWIKKNSRKKIKYFLSFVFSPKVSNLCKGIADNLWHFHVYNNIKIGVMTQ